MFAYLTLTLLNMFIPMRVFLLFFEEYANEPQEENVEIFDIFVKAQQKLKQAADDAFRMKDIQGF